MAAASTTTVIEHLCVIEDFARAISQITQDTKYLCRFILISLLAAANMAAAGSEKGKGVRGDEGLSDSQCYNLR